MTRPEDDMYAPDDTQFTQKAPKPVPKNPLTAKLMESVDKAIAENFEDSAVTSWMRSRDGQHTVAKAADMLTEYVNRSFGLAEADDMDDYSVRDLIGDFLKSQKQVQRSKNRPRRRRRPTQVNTQPANV